MLTKASTNSASTPLSIFDHFQNILIESNVKYRASAASTTSSKVHLSEQSHERVLSIHQTIVEPKFQVRYSRVPNNLSIRLTVPGIIRTKSDDHIKRNALTKDHAIGRLDGANWRRNSRVASHFDVVRSSVGLSVELCIWINFSSLRGANSSTVNVVETLRNALHER